MLNTRTNISELTKYTLVLCYQSNFGAKFHILNCARFNMVQTGILQQLYEYLSNWILAQFLIFKDILVYTNNSDIVGKGIKQFYQPGIIDIVASSCRKQQHN
ncbi:Hypothetical_protein [Hexamita inflata]|uniref:Hypothetical_protein n=1 Tax=Hexamita inflata TaxID=28002 RepID=A0ABP1KHH8_9EUKA